MTEGQTGASRRFGRFELQARVGRGGMAEVFKAVEASGPRAGRPVAIKRLLPEFASEARYLELFIGEADLSRMLHHPNIVEVYEAGSVGEQYYIAMEYIDGRDLGQVLSRCRERGINLPVDFCVFLGVALLDALAYAHAATSPTGKPLGVVHCDVSPSNVFVSRVGEIKLGDFGISKVSALDGVEATNDQVWGKAYYLSPEAVEGEIDPRCDLWAAAVTLYEILAGERPFAGPDPDAVTAAVKKARPKPLRALRPDASEALESALMRGLARSPSARYPDAASFASALRPLYDEVVGNPMAIAAVVRGLFGA